MRIRRHNNLISSIVDGEAFATTDKQQIDAVFYNHFSSIWSNPNSKSFDQILESIPNDVPAINSSHIDSLNVVVTRVEVYNTIISLPKGKSLGPYGMNAEFYNFSGMT